MDLKDKNIILCVTGGIAAYKAVNLASFLKKQSANVYAVLSKNACEFITPLTFKTITRKKVITKMFDDSDFIPHISLAESADLIIVAPATANIIAKASCGIADDMISTLLLSSKAEKIIVPAMNTKMYLNSITQKNIKTLKEYGFHVMTPDEGLLACGDRGIGKFPEIDKIYGFIERSLPDKTSYYYKKKILISIGGTIEDIDPVRYISNRSSGKMGFAVSEYLISKGAELTIVMGNVSDLVYNNFCKKYPDSLIVKVRSADEMSEKIKAIENNFDIFIMASAVADYKPEFNEFKIKKVSDKLQLDLSKTKDILKNLKKRKDAVYIGFAAESDDLINSAKEKLKNKNLDFIIANIIKGEKNAIGSDEAEVYLLNKYNKDEILFEYENKTKLAQKIFDKIEKIISSVKSV